MENSIFIDLNNSDKEFHNEIFLNAIIEKDIETKKDIFFKNCTFKSAVLFENLNGRELSFYECKFEKAFFLSNSDFIFLNFNKCIFEDGFDISSNKSSYLTLEAINAINIGFNGEFQSLKISSSSIKRIYLKNINIESSLKKSQIEFLVGNEIGEVRFNTLSTFSEIYFLGGTYERVFFEGVFEERINFSKENLVIKDLFFESSLFKKRIDIENGKYENVCFYRSSFSNLVCFNDYEILKAKNSELEIQNLSLHSCYFEMDLSMHLGKIKYLDLSNNNFKQTFYYNNFQNSHENNLEIALNFNGINQGSIIIEGLNTDIVLSGINFGNILFKDLNISCLRITDFHNNGNISFSNIKSGKYFVIQDSITGKLNFLNFDINIFKEIVIANSTLIGINFNKYPNKIHSYSKNAVLGYGIRVKSNNNSNLRNVYNQLKHVAKSNGDIDISNKFQSLEYKKLLFSKKISFDTILLFLNWISNNNGRSWSRGIAFTVIVAFIFFRLYLYNLNINFDFNECYSEYILFITSFPKLELEAYSNYNNHWKIKLIIWLSRIFISYGIYQTIAAFRKYGKS